MNETIDQDIFGEQFMSIKQSRLLDVQQIMNEPTYLSQIFTAPADVTLSMKEKQDRLRGVMVYEGIIRGDRKKLEAHVSQEIGRKVIIIERNE